MHNVIPSKSKRITIAVPSFGESYGKIRGEAIPQGKAFKDKRNDYRRTPKHKGRGWETED